MKKLIAIVLCILLFVIMIPQIVKSVAHIDYTRTCDCKVISEEYKIQMEEDAICYTGYNGLGQIKGYAVTNNGLSLTIVKDLKDVQHTFKEKMKLIDTVKDTYNDMSLTVEFYTFNRSDLNGVISIYNIFYLEKEDAILYGSIALTKNSLFMETKSSIVEEIKNTLDEYFLPKE